jgi:hypothetical protein
MSAPITEEKLRIFRRYGGDVDGWVKVGDRDEHRIMSDQDWWDIEELRHRLWLQQHEPVAAEFVGRTKQLIQERIYDERAEALLNELI